MTSATCDLQFHPNSDPGFMKSFSKQRSPSINKYYNVSYGLSLSTNTLVLTLATTKANSSVTRFGEVLSLGKNLSLWTFLEGFI